ncbi:MAG: winged helix-turn-helix domain-containing protein [bacterium]
MNQLSASTPAHILLVEDDLKLASLTATYLQNAGFNVTKCHEGSKAVSLILQQEPALVILDLMLPGKSGLDICREIHPVYDGGILMFTACDDDLDHLLGLEMGADDYVIKPVQPRLLLARIHALLRRIAQPSQASSDSSSPTPPIAIGGFEINALTRSASLHGEDISLTTAEFDLLLILARHAGQFLSRDDILKAVRGIGYDGTDRSIDLRISRLRKKLKDPADNPLWIKTIRGKGYLFAGAGT